MGNLKQENNIGNGKDKDTIYFGSWMKNTDLFNLLVDVVNKRLCDVNGSLSKQNIEQIILPRLNAKTKFPKSRYLNWMKWFRNQNNKMSTLMRKNSTLDEKDFHN